MLTMWNLINENLTKDVLDGRYTMETSTDIVESEDNVVALLDMPGVKAENVNLDINGKVLTVTGNREKVEAGEGRAVKLERATTLTRKLLLTDKLDASSISATTTDGVLTITINKKAEAKPRKIEVKAL